MEINPKCQKAICILGMHRSGTSTITRSLNLLGVYLGKDKDIIPPYPENPEGFWERWDIYHLQEALLAALKRSWDTAMPFPDGWQTAAELQPFKSELAGLIKENFADVALWGWKDPRSMLLFDIWKDVLADLNTGLSVVFAVRNPLDVARSLEKRNGFTLDKGFGIWFNYNISALRTIVGIRTVFISYDRFLANWEQELRRCAVTLTIDWPHDDTELKESMKSFIRSDLRHSCSTMDDLLKAGAPKPVVKLYGLLATLLDGAACKDSLAGAVNDLYAEFFEYSRFYRHEAVTARVAAEELQAAKGQLASSELKLAEVQRQLAELNCAIVEPVCKVTTTDAECLQCKQQLQEVMNSWSWKITGPLRALHRIISGGSSPLAEADTQISASKADCNNHFYNIISSRTERWGVTLRNCSVDIIVPVYNALELTQACIATVLNNSDNCRLIVVNDASSDQGIKDYLDSLLSCPEKKIEVIVRHHKENLGFLKTVNDAYELTKDNFVILNSDTEVPPGWLDRLFAPIFADPANVASVTPFANSSLGWLGCNFPDLDKDNEIFKNMTVAELDSFFLKYSPVTPVEIFSGCGFCMAFNRSVVEKIGLFDYDTFGKGYGEEVEWSLRAVDSGYKNLLVPNLFVYHKYGGSFDPLEKKELVEANVRKLQLNYPAHMERMESVPCKDAFRSIIDALAIIVDTQTRSSKETWVGILGEDLSFRNLIKPGHTGGFVCIDYDSAKGMRLQVLSRFQDRNICLPCDAFVHLENILNLLGVDMLIVIKEAVWPESIDLWQMVKHTNRPCAVVESESELSLFTRCFQEALTGQESFVALFDLMASIDACRPLQSKSEMNAATVLIEKLGLTLHNDFQKNWDTLKALYYVARATDSSANILDAGGGLHSPVLNALSEFGYSGLYACDVVDVNYSPEKFSDKIKFTIQSIEQTDYPNQFFSAVTCLSVIEHGVNHQNFFAEMSRILKQDGLLIITADYWPEFIDCSGIYPYGSENPEMKVYQADDIDELVRIGYECGFELCAPLDLAASERAVRWDDVDREYTFIFIAMRKTA